MTGRLDALQIFQESAIDCPAVYGIDYTDMSFLCYHGSERGDRGMWRNTEIGVVIYGRIGTCYLYFTYRPVFTVSLVLERADERSVSGGSYIFIPFLQSA